MNKAMILAMAATFLISAAALAELGTNVSILYGWNGTQKGVIE